MAAPPEPRADDRPVDVHVLLEGESDAAAVATAAEVLGVDLGGVRLVAMGGITNLARHLAAAEEVGVQVRGLCDAAEVGLAVRALRHAGYEATPATVSQCGFWVCDRDLEDELVRAAGARVVLDVLAQTGLARAFATMTQQPAWRDQPFVDQVRRFAGAGSGRKLLLARALSGAVAAEDQAEPLVGLLGSLPAR